MGATSGKDTDTNKGTLTCKDNADDWNKDVTDELQWYRSCLLPPHPHQGRFGEASKTCTMALGGSGQDLYRNTVAHI